MCLPYSANASTIALVVTGEGVNLSGTYSGGATNYTNLNSDDGDTSTIWGVFQQKHDWDVTTFSFSLAPINSVTVYAKASKPVTSSYTHLWLYTRIGATEYFSGDNYIASTGYALYSYTWTTNPSTGLVWTASDINNATFGVRMGVDGNPIYVTLFYVSVDYTYDVPAVTTSAASTPTYSGGSHNCTLNGVISSEEGTLVTERGFVYGTTSNSTNPGNIVTPATYTSNWTEGSSSFGTGAFSHNIGGLTAGTTYYVRAFAKNTVGYAYGDEVSFITLAAPTITTMAATLVTTTTARINSTLSNSGGEACSVRFLVGTASGVYTANTTAVAGYTTGQSPYADLTGLVIGTQYFFRAEATNSYATTLGSELNFTTSTGVNEPTSFSGVAGTNSVSLLWVKGTGTTNTIIVRKTGSYPTSRTDGTSVYSSSLTSYKDTGLTSGTTYYYMAWGNSGTYYSTSNATLMITTLASSTSGEDLPVPTTPDSWFQSPDYTNMAEFPLYSIINFAFECFEVPKSTGWYLLALLFAVACGIFFYSSFENSNIFLSFMVVGAVIVIESMVKLVPLWNIIPFAIVAIAGIFVGERRG